MILIEPAEEILNLDYNIMLLCVKALNKTNSKVDAAEVLGISIRNLHRLIIRYNIVRAGSEGKVYFLKEKITRLKIA